MLKLKKYKKIFQTKKGKYKTRYCERNNNIKYILTSLIKESERLVMWKKMKTQIQDKLKSLQEINICNILAIILIFIRNEWFLSKHKLPKLTPGEVEHLNRIITEELRMWLESYHLVNNQGPKELKLGFISYLKTKWFQC